MHKFVLLHVFIKLFGEYNFWEEHRINIPYFYKLCVPWTFTCTRTIDCQSQLLCFSTGILKQAKFKHTW